MTSSSPLRTTRARAREQNASTLEALLGWSLPLERRRRGWTQRRLAAYLTADHRTVSLWEQGGCVPCSHHLLGLRRWWNEQQERAA